MHELGQLFRYSDSVAACLVAPFIASVLYLAYFLLKRHVEHPAEARAVTFGYLLICTVAMSLMVFLHLARPGATAAALARHIEFKGIGVVLGNDDANRKVLISGDAVEVPNQRAFRWFALPSGASIQLEPKTDDGRKVTRYEASIANPRGIVRLNDLCLNTPLDNWVKSGNTLRVNFVDTTFRLVADGGNVSIESNAGNYSSGLRDRQVLRDFLISAHGEKLLAKLDNLVDDEGVPLVDRFVLVRQSRNDSGSPVGLVPLTSNAPNPQHVSAPADDRGRFKLELFVGSNRDRLFLPASLTPGKDGRARANFLFDPPRAFPLPPADWRKKNNRANSLVLASAEFGAAHDGYLFDTGNANEAWATPAQLAVTGEKMRTPDGVVTPNETHSLGDGAITALWTFSDPLSKSHTEWIFPVIALWVGFCLCVASISAAFRAGASLAPIGSRYAAIVIWVVTACLVSVRLVIAYRASVLPPFNLSSDQAAVFERVLTNAQAASVVAPIALGLAVYIAMRSRVGGVPQKLLSVTGWFESLLGKLSPQPWRFFGRVCYLLGAFSAVAARDDSAPGLRGVLLVILGLVLEGIADARDALQNSHQEHLTVRAVTWIGSKVPEPWHTRLGQTSKRLYNANAFLWLAAFAILSVDRGSLVFFVPMAIAVTSARVIASKAERDRWVAAAVLFSLIVVVMGSLKMAPVGGQWLLTAGLAPRSMANSVVPYRMVAVEPQRAENLLVNEGAKVSPLHVNRALQQRWQTRSYLAGEPVGYFGSPLSDVGMTHPTALSDAAWSVYGVAEHGVAAGWMIVGLLVLCGLTVLRSAWTSAKTDSRRPNTRGLAIIGTILAASALYVAYANLWAVPMTGQNIPFLGLDSRADLALNLALMVAGVLLIAFPGSVQPQQTEKPKTSKLIDPNKKARVSVPTEPMAEMDRWQTTAFWAFPVILVASALWLVPALANVKGQTTERSKPFMLSPTVISAMDGVLASAQSQANDHKLALSQTDAIKHSSLFLRRLVARYERGDVAQSPMMRERGQTALHIDPLYFRLPSPFEKDDGSDWHGAIVGQGAGQRHRLFVGGSQSSIILEEGKRPASVYLDDPVPQIVASHVDLKRRDPDGRTVVYGGPFIEHGRVMLRWRDEGRRASVLVNWHPAERSTDGSNTVELSPGDVVSLLHSDAKGNAHRLSLMYAGTTESTIASVVWRNGRYHRTFPLGRDFPLAATIGDIGDRLVSQHKFDAEKQLAISLDLPLQRDLQGSLEKWSASVGRGVNRVSIVNDVSQFTTLAILDSGSGRIRAMAGVPQVDPSEQDDRALQGFARERDRARASLSSWAFANETIGSTVKPLSFAAISSQLNSTFDLSKLGVNEAAARRSTTDRHGNTYDAYRQLGDILLERGRRITETPLSGVNMDTYIRRSRTWPAIVTGTIGLVAGNDDLSRQKSEIKTMLGSPGGFVTVAGSSRDLRPRAALTELLEPRSLSVNSNALADTALIRGLASAYGPSVEPFNYNGERWDDGLEKRFLAPFDLGAATPSQRYLALPELHRADTTKMSDLDRELVRYMFGAGECRWNAVHMATNAARLATGLKVQPTLSATINAKAPEMPKPLNGAAWRKEHLLEPMQHITTLSDTSFLDGVHAAGYQMAMKTGTIDDGADKNARESEMLLFTIGRYGANGFDPAHSISGFLSIRSSKSADQHDAVKADVVKRVVPLLLEYMKRRKL